MDSKDAKKKILIVDDDYASRLILKQMAENRGFRTIEAADGLKALELARNEQPALIIMDLRMPLMDGIEATRRLKRDPKLADIPVIAVTGVLNAHEALESGCADCVFKPAEAETLDPLMSLLASDPFGTEGRKNKDEVN